MLSPKTIVQLGERARVTVTEKSGGRSTSYDIVREYAQNKIGTFTKQEALIACPSLGSSSVESALKKLVEDGTPGHGYSG